jgi:signal transduction histidine kinase
MIVSPSPDPALIAFFRERTQDLLDRWLRRVRQEIPPDSDPGDAALREAAAQWMNEILAERENEGTAARLPIERGEADGPLLSDRCLAELRLLGEEMKRWTDAADSQSASAWRAWIGERVEEIALDVLRRIISRQENRHRRETDALRREKSDLAEANARLIADYRAAKGIADDVWRKFVYVLDSMNEGFYVLDRDWKLTYANPLARKFFSRVHGRSGEVTGLTIREILPNFEGSETEREFRRAMCDNVFVQFERSSATAEGWFDVRAYPSQDGLSVFFTDITDRKLYEARIKGRARRQAILSGLGLRALSGVGVQELMDEAVAKIVETMELKHASILELLPGVQKLLLRAGIGWPEGYVGQQRLAIHPETMAGYALSADAPLIIENLETESRFIGYPLLLQMSLTSGLCVVIHGKSGPLGLIAVHATGERRFNAEDAHFLQAVANVLGAAIDRKRADEELQYVMSQARCLLWRADVTERRDGSMEWNARFMDEESILRKIPLEVREGAPFPEIWYCSRLPEDRPKADEEAFRAIRAGESFFSQEFRHRLQDGSVIWFLQAVSVEEIEPGWRHLVGVCIDITERKNLEEALRRRAEDLSDLDRRKDEFLAMLAHELRNPLAPILNAAHLLSMHDSDEPRLKRSREVIERQVRHMSRLVDDLLDASRLTRGKISLRTERADLVDAVLRSVQLQRGFIESQNLYLSVSLPQESFPVDADPIRLDQIIGNLLHNAAKFTDSGGSVWVMVGRERNEAVLRIRDTGIGIPPENLPFIFDLFAQANQNLDRSQGGLGIGLTLVKQLTEMHGGTVSARSDGAGKGSEFEIRLPLSKD